MAVIQPTSDHTLDKATIEKLKRVNTIVIVDVLARNGYEPHYVSEQCVTHFSGTYTLRREGELVLTPKP